MPSIPPPLHAPAQGEGDPTRSAPSRPLDAGALRGLFLHLLGRPPYAREREAWTGHELADLATDIVRRPEFWERWTEEQLYYFLLIDNFRPHADRVLAIPEDLQARRIGVRDAIHRIALCASFDRRNPGPDTFVTVVMEQLLGLTVQKRTRDLEIGKRMYDGEEGVFLGRKGATQADVVRIAIEDDDFLRRFVEREYRRLFDADPARKDLERWWRRLKSDPLAYLELVQEWVQSEAYEDRLREKILQPNRLYVRAMYVDLMDRLPDPVEERRMREALDGLSDSGPLRAVLARLLLDSGQTLVPEKADIPDATTWVRGLFERLLGRAASEPELKAFVSAFHEEACRPTTVVYALVSHPEYHTY